MPPIIVPATPVKAVFINALRDRRLSSASITDWKSHEWSVYLESKSVTRGDLRVPDRNLVEVAPFQLDEKSDRIHWCARLAARLCTETREMSILRLGTITDVEKNESA
jgi:hypothetical protein